MSYDFKNEKDVQEFITNLYTEYKFGCWKEKKPEGSVYEGPNLFDNCYVFVYLQCVICWVIMRKG